MKKVQVVILCGGKGTRFLPLTEHIPKVLVEVCDKSVLQHKLDALVDLASEIILVVGYLKEKIIESVGHNYKGIPIKYVEQSEQLGTGHALMCCKDILKDKFMVLNGDDIYLKSDLEELSNVEFGLLGMESENPQKFGVLEIDRDDNLISIVEKPENPPSNLTNIGAYMFTTAIFEHELVLSPRGEYEINDYFTFIIKNSGDVKVVAVNFWLPVGNPDELNAAEFVMREKSNN
ncbi:MAG: NTP transferase domain-containing protein [Nanoarchaeales archaeon]|nr:NTP transferase domain-containing protein [Nanoarchaeales archaeon]